MMECANHGGTIEERVHKWQVVDIGCHEEEAFSIPQPFLCLGKLCGGIIQQDNAIIPGIPGVLRPAPAPNSSNSLPVFGSNRFNAISSAASS